jgi:hypothetical protein
MSPQQASAIKNNEKVFPVVEKKLSYNNEDLFCGTTIKLSTWTVVELGEGVLCTAAEARPKVRFPLKPIDCSDELDTHFR